MKFEEHIFFDLLVLVKLGDLNLRHVAKDRPTITVGEYFELMSKFISLAPDVSIALKKFAEFEADNREWKNIENMITLLTDLGCEKYLHDLYSLSRARATGDWRLASFHAKQIMDDFGRLYSRVMAASKTKKPDAFDDTSTLEAYIKYLEDEETNRKMLVLAVDDSPDILTSVAAVLNNEYKVFKLPKPTMLESVLSQVTPELFLLDYQMPEMNGFDLIPIIRNLEEHKDTPIIFLTSEGSIDHVSAAVALGACDFIVKPFKAEILREKISKHIVRKKTI